MTTKRPLILYLFTSLFFLSGAAGLIYEIVWERLLELYFGVTMVSITLIVSAYMMGLGIGSLIGGRVAQRFSNTLVLYGLLEVGIALFGLFSPRIIVWVGESTAGSPYVLVFLISFAILLIPTTLMGMTLPLLTQSFVHKVETSGQVIGLLYGINTLGAGVGTLLAGYVLIGLYGFVGALYIAVLLNALVGLAAFILSRWQSHLEARQKGAPAGPMAAVCWGYRTILLASFLVGFLGLGFEILWIRVLLIVNKNTAYAFPSILFVFLVGFSVGGYFWGRKADRSTDPVGLFCKLEVAGAAVAALTFLLFIWSLRLDVPWIENFLETQKPLTPFVESNNEIFFSRWALLRNLWDYFLPIWGLVLPASLILGGGLPVLDRISINNPALSGRRVGDIHLANIIGSVTGALVVSFVLLPGVGSEWTLKLLVLCTFLFPLFAWLDRAGNQSIGRSVPGLPVLGLLALAGLILLPARREFYRALYAAGTALDTVVSESGDSVLALTFDPSSERQSGWFWIGGEINSLFPPQGIYEERALMCAGASQPKRILVIGFGGGYSSLFYTSISDVEEIVVVELLGDIAPFLRSNMESVRVTLDDPRITYLTDDGRRYLNAFPDEKFDLISIDPLRQHTAGHNNLYSEEALRIYQQHLSPGGVLCAWMDEFHIMPRTVAQVFPFVDQFRNEFMVASNDPISYQSAYMQRTSEEYADLTARIYGEGRRIVLDLAQAIDFFHRDREQILREEAGTLILRDVHPQLEYYLFERPVRKKRTSDPAAVERFQSRIEE